MMTLRVFARGARTRTTLGSQRRTEGRSFPLAVRLDAGEVHGRAHADLDVALWQSPGQIVSSSPAGAVPGNYPVRTNGDQFSDGLGDDRLEEPAGQVETANEGVNLRDPGDALGIAEHVDRPGVATAGQYDQPFASDGDNHRLVVPDRRVGP